MKNTSVIIIELHYFPCIAFFSYLTSFDEVIIDVGDYFSKQSYRNRCRINGANKVENLIVPVRGRNQKQRLSEVEIDYSQKWLNNHMRAIQSAYGKAPFFEYYAEDFFQILREKPGKLLELNKAILTKCLELLELQIEVKYAYSIDNFSKLSSLNAKNVIHPKKNLPESELYTPQIYFQIFGNNFVHNLSILDLIFCEGPDSGGIIKKSSAQITTLYKKEELIGKQILAVVNFPKKQIANFMSECLVLGAVSGKGVILLHPEVSIKNGTVVA